MDRPVRRTRAAAAAAAAVILFAAAAGPTRAATGAGLAVGFDGNGLSELDWQGTPLLTGGVELADLKLNGGDATGDTFTKTASTFDPATRTLVQTYSWGTISVAYRPDPAAGAVRTTVAVHSTGPRTVTRFGLTLLRFRPPAPIGKGDHFNGWDGNGLILHTRPDDFPIVTADWGSGRLAVCGDDLTSEAPFGFQPLTDKGEDAVLVQFTDRQPIAPGKTRTAALSVRVAAAATPTEAFVGDVLHAYAAKYPSTLKWTDRRPIGSAFLATSVAGYAHNPRGWLQDPSIDTTTPSGRQAFAAKILDYTKSSIAHLKKLDAQGVIVWDVEGQEMPHATSYLADPRMLSKVAPEMDPLADGMFAMYRRAGLRVGVTIRPTRVAKADGGRPGWMQQDVADQPAEIDAKLTYAHKRWGCTLFYVDSNVDFVKDASGKVLSDPAMAADGFAWLARRHPDCLLMPEHKADRYWAYTAPYSEYRLGFPGTSDAVRVAYPHAFSVMQVVDGPNLSDPGPVATLTAAIRHGDVLLFRPWWDDPQTADIEHLYAVVRTGHADAGNRAASVQLEKTPS